MKSTLTALAISLTVAIGVIFFRYTSIPANLSWDELEFAKLALSLHSSPYLVYSSLASGHATLYFYILNAFLSVFGLHTWVLRLPSALFGIADVALLFILFGFIFKKTGYALTGALLLATSRWFVTFARFSFEATFLLFLELSCLVLLYFYFRSKKSWLLWVSALFGGLGFHSYIAGRIFAIVPLLRLFLKKNPRRTLMYAGIVLVVMLPLAIYLLQHPDIRIGQVSVFSHSKSSMNTAQMIGENLKKTAGMFLWSGDPNGRHNFPFKIALNQIQLLLAGVGLLIMLRGWRDPNTRLFLVWIIIAIIPSLLTVPDENPNMLRTFTLLPAIMYAMVLCAKTGIGFAPSKWKKGIVFAFGIILLAAQLYDLRIYFQFQSRVARNAFEITCPLAEVIKYKAKHLADVPAKCRVGKNMF